MLSNPKNQSSISELPTEVLLFFLSLLFISAFNILLVPPLVYELATFLLLNLSAETKEILLLLVNTAVQVLLADKVKKRLQTLVTTYEGHSRIFNSWVPETSPGMWVHTYFILVFIWAQNWGSVAGSMMGFLYCNKRWHWSYVWVYWMWASRLVCITRSDNIKGDVHLGTSSWIPPIARGHHRNRFISEKI